MSTTLADQIDAFLTDATRRARLSQNTLRAYRYELRAAAKHFTAPLDQLTLTDLETWVHRENAAPSTVGRRIAALNRFFVWAVRNDLCFANPLVQREPRRARRYLPRPIRSGDERRAIDTAIAAAPQPYRLMLTILRETGMRPSEVIALNAGDITLDAGREGLRVREPKNAAERMVVLGPEATPKSLRGLRAQLKSLKGQPPHVPLFRSNRGTRVSYDALHYQWAQVCAHADLVDTHGKPRYTLHQLRHTRGTELIEQGQRMEIVQRVLGHRDPRSTQGYAELNEGQVRSALEQKQRR
jgi:integrase/recombinase XerD